MLNNLRETLRPALEKIGKGFAATGLSPNFWTAIGLVIALLSAISYGLGTSNGLGIQNGLIIGGVLLLVSGFFDMVDGQVARITGNTSRKGSYLDSMFDKIAEVAIFLGLLIGGYAAPYLVFLAISLSLLVSYARAKSDAINVKLQGVGIGERAERLLVIAILGIIGGVIPGKIMNIVSYMELAIIIVVIIAGITLIQRMIVTTKSIKE